MKYPTINRLLSRAMLASVKLTVSSKRSDDFFSISPAELAQTIADTLEKKFEFKIIKDNWFVNSQYNRIYGIFDVDPESMDVVSFPGKKKAESYVLGVKESSVGDCAFAFFTGIRLESGELVVTKPQTAGFRHKKNVNFVEKIEESIESFSQGADASWGKIKDARKAVLTSKDAGDIILNAAFRKYMPFRYCEYVYKEMRKMTNQGKFTKADLHTIFYAMAQEKMSFMVRTELLWNLHDLLATS